MPLVADISADGIPIYASWLKYLAFGYWGYAGLLVNEFGGGRPEAILVGLKANLTESGLGLPAPESAILAESARLQLLPCNFAKFLEYGPCFSVDFLANGTAVTNTSQNSFPYGYISGNSVLEAFGCEDVSLELSCGMLVALAVGCRILACIALHLHTKQCCTRR